MKALLYNRVLLVLGFIGLFIAGVLGLAKLMDKVPPCGESHGCDVVTNGPWSSWFHIPVAYYGVAAYALLTGLAVLRVMTPPDQFKRLALLGYMVSGGGALISIGLQFYSIFHIGDVCKWCMASAVTMTITVIVYALMYQELIDLKPEESRSVLSRRPLDSFLPSGLAVLLLLALSAEGFAIRNSDRVPAKIVSLDELRSKKLDLIAASPKIFGSDKAPIKILEFADLNCPSCQLSSPMVKEFVRQHMDKVCVIFRNFPLPVHKTSELAAAIDEYAFEKGQFWEYTMAVMATKRTIDDPDELFAIAAQIHLDPKDIKKRLQNENDPIYQRLTTDKNVGNAIGVSQTPTFILLVGDAPPKAYTSTSLMEALKAPPYSKIIDGTS